MKIDLNHDLGRVYAYLQARIDGFDAATNRGPRTGGGKASKPAPGKVSKPAPGKVSMPAPGEVSMIEIGYQFDQAGWVAVVFDTRARGEPDGEWTLNIEGNTLEMAHWFEAVDKLCEDNESIEVVRLDGSSLIITEDSGDEAYTCFGEMLREALLMARRDGLLARLPLAERCIMGVEEINGSYGWPAYEARETEGNARAA